MNLRLRCVALVVTAVVACGVTASTASAVVINASPAGPFTATSSAFSVSAGAFSTTCSVTLGGDLAPSIPDLPGAFVGEFLSSSAAGCTAGVLMSLLITPVNRSTITLTRILGTPPSISGVLVNLAGVTLSLSVLGTTCLYRGTVGSLAPIITLPSGDKAVGTLSVLGAQTIPLSSGPVGICPPNANVSGNRFFFSPLERVII